MAALVAMPLVLPPTVIGFYLLVALGPNGPVGAADGGDQGSGCCRSLSAGWWWRR